MNQKDIIKLKEQMPDGEVKITYFGEGFIFGKGKAKHFQEKRIKVIKKDISAQELLDLIDEEGKQ